MFFAARTVADDDARQAVLALQPDQEILERKDREDQPARLVRHEFPPVRRGRGRNRRGDDLEVLGAVGVGKDEENVAAFLEVVLQAGFTRRNDARRGQRIVG